MGENDIETMSNVTIAKYDFEDECFAGISPECLDFIAKLLVKDLRCVFCLISLSPHKQAKQLLIKRMYLLLLLLHSTRMTAADCVKHKWLQQRPAATGTATIARTASASAAKSRLKSESPTPLASESSEDSTATIEDAGDDDDNDDVADDDDENVGIGVKTTQPDDNEDSEELAQLCSTHELEVPYELPCWHYKCNDSFHLSLPLSRSVRTGQRAGCHQG